MPEPGDENPKKTPAPKAQTGNDADGGNWPSDTAAQGKGKATAGGQQPNDAGLGSHIPTKEEVEKGGGKGASDKLQTFSTDTLGKPPEPGTASKMALQHLFDVNA